MIRKGPITARAGIRNVYFCPQNRPMKTFLQRPYPVEKTSRRRLTASVLFGLFVFLFLFCFRPFQVGGMGSQVFFVSLVFGLICTACMLFLSFVVVELFPGVFSERRWTVLHEFFWVILHCLLIGLINALFAASLGMGPFTLKFIGLFELYTLAVGIFPVTISILLSEMRLSKRYRSDSQSMNVQLHQPPAAASQTVEEVVLPSENKNEDLVIHPEKILFLEAADNYVRVFFMEQDALQKRLLRSTMKALHDRLAQHANFLRVHKSYIVNCRHIDRVSGNAQGYKLHFDQVDEPVPVARKQNELLRAALSEIAGG